MNNGQVQTVLREKKTKILHFSDGIEEVTDDDSDIMDGPDEGAEQPEIDEVISCYKSSFVHLATN